MWKGCWIASVQPRLVTLVAIYFTDLGDEMVQASGGCEHGDARVASVKSPRRCAPAPEPQAVATPHHNRAEVIPLRGAL